MYLLFFFNILTTCIERAKESLEKEIVDVTDDRPPVSVSSIHQHYCRPELACLNHHGNCTRLQRR